ncbi:MAG TPA: ubiquinol-cytochrome C chaperone family protein [Pseudolabrys sp.]|nr:ubiquinol-cytochrome C chaperone family protein [Pseudolabrys sp.]
MILPLFRRHGRADTIAALYGTIVAQARSPAFYRDFAAADTVNGRLELIILHLALVLRRLFADPALKDTGQGLFDHFCADMDGSLREMGIGDLAVPKHMRRVADAYYGRAKAYDAALAAADAEPLAQALARNVFETKAVEPAARRLAGYVRAAAEGINAADPHELAAGKVNFPDPAAFATQ